MPVNVGAKVFEKLAYVTFLDIIDLNNRIIFRRYLKSHNEIQTSN